MKELKLMRSLDEGEQLWRIVMRFEKELRLVMILHHLMGYPTAQVAKILQIDESLAEQKLEAAEQMLLEQV